MAARDGAMLRRCARTRRGLCTPNECGAHRPEPRSCSGALLTSQSCESDRRSSIVSGWIVVMTFVESTFLPAQRIHEFVLPFDGCIVKCSMLSIWMFQAELVLLPSSCLPAKIGHCWSEGLLALCCILGLTLSSLLQLHQRRAWPLFRKQRESAVTGSSALTLCIICSSCILPPLAALVPAMVPKVKSRS